MEESIFPFMNEGSSSNAQEQEKKRTSNFSEEDLKKISSLLGEYVKKEISLLLSKGLSENQRLSEEKINILSGKIEMISEDLKNIKESEVLPNNGKCDAKIFSSLSERISNLSDSLGKEKKNNDIVMEEFGKKINENLQNLMNKLGAFESSFGFLKKNSETVSNETKKLICDKMTQLEKGIENLCKRIDSVGTEMGEMLSRSQMLSSSKYDEFHAGFNGSLISIGKSLDSLKNAFENNGIENNAFLSEKKQDLDSKILKLTGILESIVADVKKTALSVADNTKSINETLAAVPGGISQLTDNFDKKFFDFEMILKKNFLLKEVFINEMKKMEEKIVFANRFLQKEMSEAFSKFSFSEQEKRSEAFLKYENIKKEISADVEKVLSEFERFNVVFSQTVEVEKNILKETAHLDDFKEFYDSRVEGLSGKLKLLSECFSQYQDSLYGFINSFSRDKMHQVFGYGMIPEIIEKKIEEMRIEAEKLKINFSLVIKDYVSDENLEDNKSASRRKK